ncbi:hypothetical protein GCM10025867_41920 [Frondihabitans sucicola]|uniref:O-antigen ligase domain-containing protein n=1 Tax=Frondihabitans sucicola TaxID=1268041 RepID=A0ABM8GU02_9MICO|nr:hypothetical protein [Frondihabitans sucicola]BDZ51951.1 hypothetical protein GCM10025867_41920 [Frondihabitans sucicola]
MNSAPALVAHDRTTPAAFRATGSVDAPAQAPVIVKLIAAVSIVVVAMQIVLPQGVEVGYIVAALLMPLWIPAVRRFRGMPVLMLLGVAAVGAGLWLRVANADDHAVDTSIATSTTVLLIGAILSIGLLLWTRTLFSVSTVALLFGVGLFLGISPSAAQFASNPYKFGFAIPLAVVLLALAKLSRRWWVELIVVLVLSGLSAANDARATFALLLLAAILLLAQLPVFRVGHRGSASLVALGIVVVGIVVYNLGTALVLSGLLGQSTTERSLAQVNASGSLVLGGRPELGATIALIGQKVWGFGAGVSPSPSEVVTAKEGMKAIGYDPNNGYVERYMFGGHVELHSVFGDLWAQTGVIGLAFVFVAAVLMIYGLTRNIADGLAAGVLLYVVAKSLWDLAFSPFFSAEPLFVLAIGLVAIPVTRGAGQRVYSITESIGPIRRAARWKPSRAKTAASLSDEAAG